MASLQEIKSRINTINKIKKITKAMQLVATAKLIKMKKKWEVVKMYYYEIDDIFSKLSKLMPNINKLAKTKNNDKNLYIIITSDLGFCGSYNNNIIKLAKQHIRADDEIIILGTKGISAFKNRNYKIVVSFEDINDGRNYLVASEIAKNVVIKFLHQDIKTIKIIYTKYINSILYKPKIMTILPIKISKDKMESEIIEETEFEPNPKTILNNGLPLYTSAFLYNIMTETKVAEMSSRRLAMENATDNADELIDNLNLKYNRVRQGKITQEIAEIITGVEMEIE